MGQEPEEIKTLAAAHSLVDRLARSAAQAGTSNSGLIIDPMGPVYQRDLHSKMDRLKAVLTEHWSDQELHEATDAVIKAWTVEGSHPEYHRAARERLLNGWPTLGNAIERLIKAHEAAKHR